MSSVNYLNDDLNHPPISRSGAIEMLDNKKEISLYSDQISSSFNQNLSKQSDTSSTDKKDKNVECRSDKYSYLKEYLINHGKGQSKTTESEPETNLGIPNGDHLKIHVDGIPSTGAKSRVETQIKLSVHLQDSNGLKVQNWSYLRIDDSLLRKSKFRKNQNTKSLEEGVVDISSDESKVLSLEANVICESNESKKIKMCQGCVRRERKRSERNKNAKQTYNNIPMNNKSKVLDEAFERDRLRVLLFNCEPLVNFSSGEAVIPTRITCYCRHHNERVGFRIRFAMRNNKGVIIARGQSPIIMITDDHKSSKQSVMDRKKRGPKYEALPKDKMLHNRHTPQMDSYYGDFTPNSTPFSSHCDDNLGYFSHNSIKSAASPSSSVFQNLTSPLLTPSEDSLYLNTPTLYTSNQIQENLYSLTGTGALPVIQNSPAATDLSYSAGHKDIENLSSSSYTNSCYTNNSSLPLTLDSITQTFSHQDFQSIPKIVPVVSPVYSPEIQMISPSQGPVYGGTEITITGSGFHTDLSVMFGGRLASTVYWNTTSIVCILPPAEKAGPVSVSLKGKQILKGKNFMFNYYDNSKQQILDLSLQAVGSKNNVTQHENTEFILNMSPNPSNDGNLLHHHKIQDSTSFTDTHFEQDIISIISQVCDNSKLEKTSSGGQNILHFAAYLNYPSLVSYIASRHPVLVDTQDTNGFSPLHFACQSQATQSIQIMLNNGANILLESNFGSPASLVCEQNPLYSKDQFDSATSEKVQEIAMSAPWMPYTFATPATQFHQLKDSTMMEASTSHYENPLMIHYLDNLLYTL